MSNQLKSVTSGLVKDTLLKKSIANHNSGQKGFRRDVDLLFSGLTPNNFIDYLYSLPKFDGDDVRGAELFDMWCSDDAYYNRHVETEVIEKNVMKIAKNVRASSLVIELGPGSVTPVRKKTVPLLSQMPNLKAYVAIDKCKDYLKSAKTWIAYKLPSISLRTYNAYFDELSDIVYPADNMSFFMFGNTLFNFPLQSATDKFSPIRNFLKQVHNSLLSGYFVIGYDCNEDLDSLMAAYDNQLNAAFTLNVFHQMRRDLNMDINPDLFDFYCNWNQEHYCLNMGAIATQSQIVTLGNKSYTVEKGQKLHMWNSYKIPTSIFSKIADEAGFSTKAVYRDEHKRIAVHVLEARK